jgi:hypothetical protein
LCRSSGGTSPGESEPLFSLICLARHRALLSLLPSPFVMPIHLIGHPEKKEQKSDKNNDEHNPFNGPNAVSLVCLKPEKNILDRDA